MKHKIGKTTVSLALFSMLALSDAQAALVVNTGQIADLRVEGTYAFIGMTQAVSNCGVRYWVDISTNTGKTVYATAMMAFSSDKNIHLRVDDAGTRIFGECGVYDILVVK